MGGGENDVGGALVQAVEVRGLGEGEAVAAPGGATPLVDEHVGKQRIQASLVEGGGQHPAGVGVLDIVGVAADVGGQHRQSRHHRLQQHHAGRLAVGRMDEQVGAQQEAGGCRRAP
jgi:hypothetical protein